MNAEGVQDNEPIAPSGLGIDALVARFVAELDAEAEGLETYAHKVALLPPFLGTRE